MSEDTLLRARDLTARYGAVQVLHGVSVDVGEGEMVALLGANGAGKTTLLRAVSRGVVTTGTVAFDGRDITRLDAIGAARARIGHVPQGRGTFAELSVEENLRLGLMGRPASLRADSDRDLERVHTMFPVLRDMRNRPAGALSGGQQQMLALGRALLARPRLLLVDEPSLGLAPRTTAELFEALAGIRAAWSTAVLLAEQNARLSLRVADRAIVLARGRVVRSCAAADLADDAELRAAYLGTVPDQQKADR
ncbi:ABC transporter ATP-binding protein [Actinomadura opuntiae]|uniref:ABC transporter ATP-binding protein n=1 Tax=Actinomadura sp. OS1-43 TaxID=604315 RepID=UPI00255B21A1|nr:ABC transporter ATP-binding protein [Actinomadura sp. OS1-43]MDL4817309.1 ABC transporter ATP-binding protein [Actinomadura sp. OS1-43]